MALPPPPAPLSRCAGEGTGGEGRLPQPAACAVGYALPPAPRANLLNELLIQDTGCRPFDFRLSTFNY